MNRIEDWAKATQAHEGYFRPGENPNYPNGTPAWANNNPGNIRPTTYSKSLGDHYETGARGNFVYYKSYEIGWKALKQFLFDASTDVLKPFRDQRDRLKLKSTRELTLEQFYQVYAPQSDGNNPNRYAADVANRLGVPVSTKVGSLIEEPKPEPVPEPQPSKKGEVISRKQGDDRWGWVQIGKSPWNLAQKGCLITIISDAMHWLGIDLTPDILAKVLGYTPNGDLYWSSLERVGLKLVFRYWQFGAAEKAALKAALKHPTQCVMLEFRYAGAKHWCWCIGTDLFGRYRIADPLRGDFTLNSRYGTPSGMAVIDKK